MRLTGPEFTRLEHALRNAFVSYDDLRPMVRGAGWSLQDIVAEEPMPSVVLGLIEYAEARDRVHELVAAARASNPTNEELLEVSAAIGIDPAGIPREDLSAESALPEVTAHFERMVDTARGIADLGSFAAKIHELLRQVCAVELGNEFGTGFLIGPDTVLTNYHVVEQAIRGTFAPDKIRLRFDYQRLRDGATTQDGVRVELADDWLVAAEKYSAADSRPYSEANLPAADELDFAVLRTKDQVGLAAPAGPVEAPRGWVQPSAQPYDFPKDSFLMVVQHPCNDPIGFDELADAVLRMNPNETRVHYRNNTMPGSSGSPVLNRDLALVALHHAGQPGRADFGLPCHQRVTPAEYNEGIPIAAIQQHLAGNGAGAAFGGDPP